MKTDIHRDILRRYWGYDDFRGIQREIIESIAAGHDTLGLMPTGGGKSITFQVPALASEGVCLVITPLVALMKDQVINLRKRGIKAAAIHSGMSHDSIIITLENAVLGGVKILYVSPERLSSQLFQTKIRHAKVSFITVDEAHCISQWGYDFRPSYLQIADIRKILPDVPCLALTATATPEVVDDIQERLGFAEKRVFKMSFERENLAYMVRQVEDKREEIKRILEETPGCSIIYARSRQRVKDTSDFLNEEGISSTYYHAGLDSVEKDLRQKEWLAGKKRVMVATNAFGMGIDKPDVRTVIHIDCPDSLEAYFQEAGRAGRDGLLAYAVLLYNGSDKRKLERRKSDHFPEKDFIRTVYDHLAYFYQLGVGGGYNAMFEFNIDRFCHSFKHFPIQVEAALRILERAGYIDYIEEQDSAARVMFTIGRDDLYRLKNNSPEEDKTIVALLRNYSGLFSDYNFIDESFIAKETGLEQHLVYITLKELSHKNIISFIPRKSTPYIRYTQRREESKHLRFPKEIYDNLKERYIARIESMFMYATNDCDCRSRQLLAYFGETQSKDCMLCDVCRARMNKVEEQDVEEARKTILELLKDKEWHSAAELNTLKLNVEIRNTALRILLDDEDIYMEDGGILINKGNA